MKICPVCRLELADTYLFCSEDGTALSAEAAASPVLAASSGVTHLRSIANAEESAVVLYCPQCAAEYPLTFSECPVHGIPLTNRKAIVRVPPAVKPRIIPAVSPAGNSLKAASPAPPQALPAAPLRTAPLDAGTRVQSSPLESYEYEVEHEAEPTAIVTEDHAIKNAFFPSAAEDENANPRSLRRAANVIVVMLILFGVAGLYTLIKHLTRRPTLSNASRVAKVQEPPQPTITIPTPTAALEYMQSPPPSPPVDNNTEARREADGQRDREATRKVSPAHAINDRAGTVDTSRLMASPKPVTPPPVTRPLTRAADLSLPRPSGQIDAHLLNVRSNRTARGYRYDLTFNVQERGGQATQLERLVISTRSTSGVNHAQAIPFYHRLGATGTLTFTVSVEMPGRAPADWQGRVLCTSIGSDVEGKIHQASFGATVTPN